MQCGHNFCQGCLTQCWGEEDVVASCPQCREIIQTRKFIPNQKLANFVEIAKKFSLPGRIKIEGEGRVCKEHQEPLARFCTEDKSPICVICSRTKKHRFHQVFTLEEACQHYKRKLSKYLENLRHKADAEEESQDLLRQIEAERVQMMYEFGQLHHVLEEQERFLLTQMEKVKKEIKERRDNLLATLLEEHSTLESTVLEIEELCQPLEFLEDIGNILNRYNEKSFENPLTFPPALRWRIQEFSGIIPFLEKIKKKLKDNLSGDEFQKANITLDPDTAYPKLILSEDYKSVICGDHHQTVPNNPERFDFWPFVLGCEGFTAGRHFWEVTVESEGGWAVGVARKSVRRKGELAFSPDEGIWAVGNWEGEYKAVDPPHYSHLALNGKLKRIRISLNYAGGQVIFYDAESMAQLFAFSTASFSGDTLHPFFWVTNNSHLMLFP